MPPKAALDDAAKTKHGPIILTSIDQQPWTSDGFRASWRKACRKAGIVGITFNDLRGTAVTRLALAGCTEAEIAAITGHSLRDVRSILDVGRDFRGFDHLDIASRTHKKWCRA